MVHAVVNAPGGNVGRPLSERLLAAGCTLTLLSRHPEKVRDLVARGATVLQGNLEDQDFVVTATRGADVLFWLTPPNPTAPSMREYQNKLGRIAAHAVRENRIARVVHLSSYGAHLDSGTGPILGLRDVEGLLNRAVTDIVHLRPGMFMENYLMSLSTIRQMQKVLMPIPGSLQVPFVSTHDVAMVAAERILGSSWRGQQVLEVMGPAPISFDDAARCIGEVMGQPVTHVQVSRDQAFAALTDMGMSPDVTNGLLEMYAAIESGHLVPDPRAAKRLMPTTFAGFVRAVLAPLLRDSASRR